MTARVGVIGCGFWATMAHIPALVRDPRATVVALTDRDEQRLAAAAERFGVERTFTDAEQMFAETELDAVVIAVPHAAHYPVAKLALESGVHVMLEKPMVIEPEHGRELNAIARERGLELIIGYPRHYNKHATAVRDAIASGRLGRVEFVNCCFGAIVRELYAGRPEAYREAFGYTVNAPCADTYSDPAVAGGGQAQTNLTHAVALLLWMTGLEVSSIAAFTESFELDVDLVDVAAVRFTNGALASIGSTGSMLPGHDEILDYHIFCSEGHIVLDAECGRLAFHTASGVEVVEPLTERDEQFPDWGPTRNLVDVVLGEGPNLSSGDIGLAAVELIDGIYRSAAAGKPVAVSRHDGGA
jgi:predicted dehydrogenase